MHSHSSGSGNGAGSGDEEYVLEREPLGLWLPRAPRRPPEGSLLGGVAGARSGFPIHSDFAPPGLSEHPGR